jgi:hypothetical protein
MDWYFEKQSPCRDGLCQLAGGDELDPRDRGGYHLYLDDQASTQINEDLDDALMRFEPQKLFVLPKSGG